MEHPRYKIGDIVEAENIHGTKFIFKVAEIRITPSGEILYLAASHFTGLKESEVRLADSQKNSYDLMFDEMSAEKAKLTDDFRKVAKILAERNPEFAGWLLCNWGSELSGHI